MEMTFGYILNGWLKKAGSTGIWVEFVLTSVVSGWGQQCNQGLGNFFKGFTGTFHDFCQNGTKHQSVVVLPNMNRNLTCWSDKTVAPLTCSAELQTHHTQ
eukprot:13702965-Ditylum_brightwellii.AAC.1